MNKKINPPGTDIVPVTARIGLVFVAALLRVAKYNQFLRIEQLLGKNAVYAGLSALKKSK
jgi:enolase